MKPSTTLLRLAAMATAASAAAIPEQLVFGPHQATAKAKGAPAASRLHRPIKGLIAEVKALLGAIAGDVKRESGVVCFCSAGVVCCDVPEGAVCGYGTCGV